MTILGISAFYHDSAAAIIQNGEVIAAAQEERFSRKKHDPNFPLKAIQFCLYFSGREISEIDAIVFYDKPLLKFERLLETYYAYAPKGLLSFITSMPIWLKEKLFLKDIIWKELATLGTIDKKKTKLLFTEHHLSHAASAFFPSSYERAAILTIDGVGEWATASICLGEGNKITILKELGFPHSVGLLYSAFTYFCGFKVNSGEYKLMGLAPYGDSGSEQVNEFVSIIKTHLVRINDDGSIFLNQEYFSYATELRMVDDAKWLKLFGFKKREPETTLKQHHCNLALAIQQITEEIVLNLARTAKKLTNAEYLCMAGGVALNCVANGKIDDAKIFKQIFITPAAGDAGGALGAAYAAHFIYFNNQRKVDISLADQLKGSYLGPEYSDQEIMIAIRKYNAPYKLYEDLNLLLEKTASLLAAGKVIGWHQGRMEFGPRALGARSIIADSRNPNMQKTLNLKIKHREGFRPFAPIVPIEDVNEYFEHCDSSPYMLLVKPVKKSRRLIPISQTQPNNLLEKLYSLRSDIPSVTHIDYSARIQTVHKQTNLKMWKLLNSFKTLTGTSVLINTSFNVRGEPIVNTPEESYRCFMRTEMDYLIIGNFILAKDAQPEWKEGSDWMKEFQLD